MDWIDAERGEHASLTEFFADLLAKEEDGRKFELLLLAAPCDGVCYGAYRFCNTNTGEERVSALVIELEGEYEVGFRYRLLTEYDGPRHHHCPREIYNLLTRFRHCEESAPAKAWRDRVEAWHRRGA